MFVSADALLVCPPALLLTAGTLAGIAGRMALDAGTPAHAPVGDLAAGEALVALAAAACRRMEAVAADTAEVAALVRRAAAEYDAADDRAVWRTRESCG